MTTFDKINVRYNLIFLEKGNLLIFYISISITFYFLVSLSLCNTYVCIGMMLRIRRLLLRTGPSPIVHVYLHIM